MTIVLFGVFRSLSSFPSLLTLTILNSTPISLRLLLFRLLGWLFFFTFSQVFFKSSRPRARRLDRRLCGFSDFSPQEFFGMALISGSIFSITMLHSVFNATECSILRCSLSSHSVCHYIGWCPRFQLSCYFQHNS